MRWTAEKSEVAFGLRPKEPTGHVLAIPLRSETEGHPRVARLISRNVVLIALTLTMALPLRANPDDDETRALGDAQQAYRDGAFDVVNDRVAALLKKFPKTELRPQAELLQAQALYQLGRDDDAIAAFTLPPDQVPAPLLADTLFWQAQALLDDEKWPEAEAKFKALLALKDMAGHAGEADLGLAWAVFKQGREAEAMPIIQQLAADKKNPVPAQ